MGHSMRITHTSLIALTTILNVLQPIDTMDGWMWTEWPMSMLASPADSMHLFLFPLSAVAAQAG